MFDSSDRPHERRTAALWWRLGRPLLLVLVLILPGIPARALDRTPLEETELWVPSIAVFGGFTAQNISGAVESSDLMGPGAPIPPNPPERIQPSADGRDLLLNATVGGSFELMTPRLFEPRWSPRVFTHGGVAGAFGFKRSVAGNGSPGPMVLPPLGDILSMNIPEQVVEGQGSRTFAETDSLLVMAGAGLAFTFEVFERRLRIKPSVEYMREEIEISGIVNRAVKVVNPATSLADFRLISLSASTTEVYHGVGPGLEIEYDTFRTGPVMLTAFLGGQAYAFFGDRDVELEARNEFGEWARFSFEKQQWGWGMRAGLRFRWQPEF